MAAAAPRRANVFEGPASSSGLPAPRSAWEGSALLYSSPRGQSLVDQVLSIGTRAFKGEVYHEVSGKARQRRRCNWERLPAGDHGRKASSRHTARVPRFDSGFGPGCCRRWARPSPFSNRSWNCLPPRIRPSRSCSADTSSSSSDEKWGSAEFAKGETNQ